MKLSNSTRQNVYGNILVGLSFMALTFLTVKTFAPDIRSNAETNTAEQTVGPYTASISLDSATAISITPTASQAVYTGTNEISYTNTCPYGFNVTMSSNSENTNLTRLGDDTATKTIPTISSGTALTDNTWGYSTDGGTTYNAIPALANPATIINTSAATTTAATLDLTYGVKTDNSLPSGSYINDLIYTVSVKPQCLSYGITWDMDGGTAASGADYPASLNFGSVLDLTALAPTKEGYIITGWSNGTDTFDGTETDADINPNGAPSLTMTAQWEALPSMQEFSCSTLSVGDTIKLRDARDNKEYMVRKLADRKCWMTQNLRLINKTISSADSNLPSGETYTVPASNLSSLTTSYNTNSAYLDSTHGGYYNFYTATAGWGTDSVASGNSPKDICPKGWHLPTGGSSGEFQELYNKYNSSTLMQGDPGFALSGYITDGSFSNQESHSYSWSSSVYDTDRGYSLALSSSTVGPANNSPKYRGFPVRCVANMEKMQDFDSSTLSANESKELEDIRDNKVYTVKKLADGKVWMTENLRLIDKAISSDDSNLPSGTTWTIPASSVSGFSAQNTNNAYLDSTYGGYYTFYTATAGWGTDSVTSGNAPKDICPKGWRLPTGGSSGELQTLYDNYNSSTLMQGDPGFVLSGYVGGGSVNNQDVYGYYWSSSVVDASRTYFLGLNSSGVNPTNYIVKSRGFSVRCVAEERTISDITYMQDMTPKIAENTAANASATLIDIRDSKTYTVKKLKDGKVWMTQNLSLINKTISSADSNLPSGGTWTIPASSVSGFSNYNTNNAYVDSTYGGYYTFYAVTAGWGTNSVTSGNAPKDICPKGWRLPTGGSSGEFQTLYNNYNSSALMQGEPNFTLSGYVYGGSVSHRGSGGYFWSSTVYNANRAYSLGLNSSSVYPALDRDMGNGFSVRCMAK